MKVTDRERGQKPRSSSRVPKIRQVRREKKHLYIRAIVIESPSFSHDCWRSLDAEKHNLFGDKNRVRGLSNDMFQPKRTTWPFSSG